jgi:uncharacterized membrane protein
MEKTKETPRHLANTTARNASLVVLVLAILVSGYLSYLKVANVDAVCVEAAVFDCGTVLNSFYSEISGIPIAWLGLAVNLIATVLLILEPRVEFLRRFGVALIFGLILFAFLFSMYLIYVQAVLIKAYCPWCLSHEALITILFGLSAWRLSQWDMSAA